jgi:hypothetical protein
MESGEVAELQNWQACRLLAHNRNPGPRAGRAAYWGTAAIAQWLSHKGSRKRRRTPRLR